MKTFLSWSGERSHAAAKLFADWLPVVLQACKQPFISSNIESGTQWFPEITSELSASGVGFAFITPENQNSTWLNFEAGAMVGTFGNPGLIPVLVGLKKADYGGPMKNLHMAEIDDKDAVKMVLRTINRKCESPVEETNLDKLFEMSWPEFEQQLLELSRISDEKSEANTALRSDSSKIDELLDLTRGLAARDTRYAEPATLRTGRKDGQERDSVLERLLEGVPPYDFATPPLLDDAKSSPERLRNEKLLDAFKQGAKVTIQRKSDGATGKVISIAAIMGSVKEIIFHSSTTGKNEIAEPLDYEITGIEG